MVNITEKRNQTSSNIVDDEEYNYALQTDLSDSNIRDDHLNNEEKTELHYLMSKYFDIQYHEGENLTFTNEIKHVIKTKHEEPIYRRPYSYPYIYDAEVEKQIEEMIRQGIITKSKSPYCSPIVMVPKERDASAVPKFRMAIDYRGLNKVTINDKFRTWTKY